MLNKNSKRIVIGIVALIIGYVTFTLFLSNGNAATNKQISATPSVEQAASPTPAAELAPSNKSVTVSEKAPNLLTPPTATSTTKLDIAAAIKDRVIGNENAPVTIIEYTSLTCSYCAHFSEKIRPEIKRLLIDTGKAKLIFRDFPLDNIALRASMMARCVPEDKFFSMIEVLFNNQRRWIRNKNPLVGLAQLGSLAGMDEAAFKKCTQNVELETALLNVFQKAQRKYNIRATPTFIFNDGAEKMTGARNANDFVKIVDKLIKGK
ncbi:MAG: thioredoxin domain-containing protein [Alphaproteobacteria bacterium]|nr:thioredoxin domain-containing protein [Alphaproteobacteria bacterium]